MNNWIRIPGFPAPDKQDSVRFYVLKSLSYSARMLLYLLFIGAGFSIQLLMINAWPGAVLLVFAAMLNLVRGYDSRVRLKTFDIDSSWTEVDMDRIREIERIDGRITKWDRDALDISNALGAGIFVTVVIGLFIFSMILTAFSDHNIVGTIFLTDAVILVIPLWFNGIRRVLKQDNLRVKIGIVRKMEEHFRYVRKEGEAFKPALMLARDVTGKSVPTDTRFTISFYGMPAGFYGIQAQINLNIVQGASYPYFYCVIPAAPGFGLREFINQIPKQKDVIIEFQNDRKAEVIVIRQYTTKTSGYHTTLNSCKNIFDVTIAAARIILGA